MKRPPFPSSAGMAPGMRIIPSNQRATGTPTEKHSLFEGVSPGNVGNVFEVPPSPIQDGGLASFGRPVRVLEVKGEDVLGEMLCISLQQETEVNIPNTDQNKYDVEGPLVGIVEFGAGAGVGSFEFDIPAPVVFPGNVSLSVGIGPTTTVNLPASRRNNGILLTLPASSLRVYVRNDANAPYLGNIAAANPAISLNESNKNPGKIRVHSTYGRRPFQAHLTRSFPIVFSDNGGDTDPFFQTEVLFIGIPAYAKSVYFPRGPLQTTRLEVSFFMGQLTDGAPSDQNFRGDYIVPAGSDGPLTIQPYDTVMRITNPALSSANITGMQVVFELAI